MIHFAASESQPLTRFFLFWCCVLGASVKQPVGLTRAPSTTRFFAETIQSSALTWFAAEQEIETTTRT